MSQDFKTLYFPDHPAHEPKKKNIKIAFGKKDQTIFESISGLSSDELRLLIGHSSYLSLKKSAERLDLPLNTYCLRTLRSKVESKTKRSSFAVDPIQTTFRGGGSEPLHGWYPFLEGYSPRFVHEIYNTFCKGAKHVYDPFGGTGTTPLTIASLGASAYYSEINPLLQFLIRCKIKALDFPDKKRSNLIASLSEIEKSFLSNLKQVEESSLLRDNYSAVFGKSIFFDKKTFSQVLKTRTLIDDVACQDTLASQFLTIAAISSLVPSSLLKRAGDLRFKTKAELKKGGIAFTVALRQKLKLIIKDLTETARIKSTPTFLSEDAKTIGALPALGFDAVITSPPYLNGTNYFRNTKVELWFLKCLQKKEDLSDFRNRAITAGINDVSLTQPSKNHQSVKHLVKQLDAKAYDRRIPKMVASYFSDMTQLFSGLKKHLVKNAMVAIDIGDSVYCDVHVPTHQLLKKILAEHHYDFKHEVILRRRLSRNRTPLHQYLLVFKYAKPRPKKEKSQKTYWQKDWNSFKRTLPHQEQPYAKRNWGHPLHSLCSYQGKMKPSLAHFLVKTFLPDSARVLDPFGGVGTIPFEASLLGHQSFTFEISPAAHAITKAKLRIATSKDCEKSLKKLEAVIQKGSVDTHDRASIRDINFNRSIKEYFHKKTLNEILMARGYFRKHPPKSPADYLVLASLLHILHGNRPYALSRRSHPITPFAPTGPMEYRPLIPRVKDKVMRSLEAERPSTFKEGTVYTQDALSWWPREVSNLDAVITSPPFFDSTRFHLGNWMRLWFCGWNKEDFTNKPSSFVDERQKFSFSIYETIFRQSRERLKKDGVVVMHLGMSKKCDMAKELSRVAKKWFKVADIFSEKVTHTESHGIRDKGTVTAHQFLILQ